VYYLAIQDYEEKTRFRVAKQAKLKESSGQFNTLIRANKELAQYAKANYTGAQLQEQLDKHKAAAAVIASNKGQLLTLRDHYAECERQQYEAGLLCLKVTHTPVPTHTPVIHTPCHDTPCHDTPCHAHPLS